MNKIRMLAQGLVEGATNGGAGTVDAFKSVMEGMFPYLEKTKGMENKQMIDKMSEEVAKGPLFFSAAVTKPLRTVVKNIKIDDDFKTRLQARARTRKKV